MVRSLTSTELCKSGRQLFGLCLFVCFILRYVALSALIPRRWVADSTYVNNFLPVGSARSQPRVQKAPALGARVSSLKFCRLNIPRTPRLAHNPS
ncbi:uncharacterized protein EI90DRAFT_3033812 [Cantharellus anzutake]|uniref:uncharacterized protein n=1 Tax=Cantharellus anzutake TaxID=1750568 RepID=UPI001907DCBC|nr:uncharacterized protein EI90DRAFT_3033812 [Cantharellus anzutake]KAF8341393.1 hypothetical protein EI90DRAFT_3033812 [Cantharellus anzutake]